MSFFLSTIIFIVGSCNNVAVSASSASDTVKAAQQPVDTTLPVVEDSSEFIQSRDAFVTMYITIADTGFVYYPLDAKMYSLCNKLKIPIDTMNRHFDASKNEIVNADDDDDEMYRDEYFPRRFPSVGLSLEHLTTYTENTTKNTIALVAAICESKQTADSVLKVVRPASPRSFVLKGRVYVGCMH